MSDSTPPKPPASDTLPAHLDYLKLVFVREHYEILASEAAADQWGHVDYLASLIQGEALARQQRSIQRRIHQARFPVIKTLEPFQWT
jgi:DNA replication protein DnaC